MTVSGEDPVLVNNEFGGSMSQSNHENETKGPELSQGSSSSNDQSKAVREGRFRLWIFRSLILLSLSLSLLLHFTSGLSRLGQEHFPQVVRTYQYEVTEFLLLADLTKEGAAPVVSELPKALGTLSLTQSAYLRFFLDPVVSEISAVIRVGVFPGLLLLLGLGFLWARHLLLVLQLLLLIPTAFLPGATFFAPGDFAFHLNLYLMGGILALAYLGDLPTRSLRLPTMNRSAVLVFLVLVGVDSAKAQDAVTKELGARFLESIRTSVGKDPRDDLDALCPYPFKLVPSITADRLPMIVLTCEHVSSNPRRPTRMIYSILVNRIVRTQLILDGKVALDLLPRHQDLSAMVAALSETPFDAYATVPPKSKEERSTEKLFRRMRLQNLEIPVSELDQASQEVQADVDLFLSRIRTHLFKCRELAYVKDRRFLGEKIFKRWREKALTPRFGYGELLRLTPLYRQFSDNLLKGILGLSSAQADEVWAVKGRSIHFGLNEEGRKFFREQGFPEFDLAEIGVRVDDEGKLEPILKSEERNQE